MNWLQQPFIQIALPIVITLIVAAWLQGRSMDTMNARLGDLRADMNRGFERVEKRLDAIDATLKDHGEKIARLEERSSPLARR